MSELPNRDLLEARFAKRFGKVARRHMREYLQLLGNPPDEANIPEEFWKKVEKETDSELYAILLLIFSESSIFHGWDGAEANLAAYGWATNQAQLFAAYWVSSSQSILNDGFAKLRRPKPIPERTVEEAREAVRTKPSEPQGPSKDDINHLLVKVFGPKRVARASTIQTTRARSSGAEMAMNEQGLLSENDIYVNPDDLSTCDVCHPLIGLTRSQWTIAAPDGPPPTLSQCQCRCAISYEADRIRDGVNHISPMWTRQIWADYIRNPERSRRKSMTGKINRPLNLQSWYRTIPESAEWRAHCCENQIAFDDRGEFEIMKSSGMAYPNNI